MQQVKDEKKFNAQKVDSLQFNNRSWTCCKLSQKIIAASPQFLKGEKK